MTVDFLLGDIKSDIACVLEGAQEQGSEVSRKIGRVARCVLDVANSAAAALEAAEEFDPKECDEMHAARNWKRKIEVTRIFGEKRASEIVEYCKDEISNKDLEDLKAVLGIEGEVEFVHYEDSEKQYDDYVYIRIDGKSFFNIYLRAYGNGSVEVGDLCEDIQVQHSEKVLNDPSFPDSFRRLNGERFGRIFDGF